MKKIIKPFQFVEKKEESSVVDTRDIDKATRIVEVFENLLEEKDIDIPCDDEDEEYERHNETCGSRIYGMEYYNLLDEVQAILDD